MQFDVSHASYSYPGSSREVLTDINYSFDCRGILSILGRNGAGKTTLLKCMLGLRRWKSGASLIDGTDIRTVPARTFWQRRPSPRVSSTAFSIW